MKYSKGLKRKANEIVESAPTLAMAIGTEFRHLGKTYRIVRCPSDHNPHVDNCMICAPFWCYFPRELKMQNFIAGLLDAALEADREGAAYRRKLEASIRGRRP